MTNKKLLNIFVVVCFAAYITQQASVTVNKLDGISSSNLVYSGLLPISDSSSDQLFFTYYGAKQAKQQGNLKNYPLIVVVGSPGSSAQYLNFGGMGPLTLKPDMTTTQNSNTVTNYANVMFVDLLGNGFSFASDSSNLPTKYEDYGVHLTYAINNFAKQSPLGQSSTVVLVGEGPFLRALPGLDDIDTLSGIAHLSAWPELNAIGKYYGVAGKDLKIFGDSERVAIQSTFISCSNYVRSSKFVQAHTCLDSVLNFVESKTKNVNLFNVQLGSNLTQHLAMIQYYLSQSSIVSAFKAPTSRMFQTQSNWIANKTYADLAVNKTGSLSSYMKDYMSVKHWYVSGDSDYISYKNALRTWLDTQLSFVESATFSKLKLQDVTYNGKTVGYGKQVKQVKYTELISSGHYGFWDQTQVLSNLMKEWIGTLSNNRQKYITQEASEIIISEQ